MKRLLLACCLLLALPAFAQTPSLTFTIETTNANATSVTPRLTWTTAPAGAACVASAVPAATGWSGAKAASGTQLMPAISASNAYTLDCTWPGSTTAIVSWVASTTNTDGSALTNLAGYRIVYGTSSSNLDQSAYQQSPTLLTWTSPTLAPGTWYFGVRAFNAQGLESDTSNIASKVLKAAASQSLTREIVIRFPSPPTSATAN